MLCDVVQDPGHVSLQLQRPPRQSPFALQRTLLYTTQDFTPSRPSSVHSTQVPEQAWHPTAHQPCVAPLVSSVMQQLPQNAIRKATSVRDTTQRSLGSEGPTPAVRVDVTLNGQAVGAGGHGAVVKGLEKVSRDEGWEGADGEDGNGEEVHFGDVTEAGPGLFEWLNGGFSVWRC